MLLPRLQTRRVSRVGGAPGAVTFTRTGATAYDSAGNNYAANAPRFDSGAGVPGTTNLLTANQSSVETDTTGFLALGTAVITRSNAWSWTGSWSLKVDTASSLSANYMRVTSPGITNGLQHTASAYIYNPNPVPISVGIDVGGYSGGSVVVPALSVGRAITTITATSTTSGELRFWETNGPGLTFYVDGIQWERQGFATPWTLGGTTRAAAPARGGLLIEEASTNLATVWDPNASNMVSQTLTSNATKMGAPFTKGMYYDGSAATKTAFMAFTFATNTTYTASFYVRMDDGAGPPTVSGASTSGDMSINIGGALAGSTITVRDMGHGLYRVAATLTTGGVISQNWFGITQYNTQAGRAFSTSGWQLEQKGYATTTIVTTGSSVTRNAETCTLAGIASLLNPYAGTVLIRAYCDWDAANTAAANGHLLFRTRDASAHNEVGLFRNSGGSVFTVRMIDNAGTTSQQTASVTAAMTVGLHVYAVKWDGSELAFWEGGVRRMTVSNPSLPSTFAGNTFYLGTDQAGGFQWNAPFMELEFLPYALSPSELATLTANPNAPLPHLPGASLYLPFSRGSLQAYGPNLRPGERLNHHGTQPFWAGYWG